MAYRHLREVVRGEVADGQVTLIVQINDITEDNQHAVIVQEGAHTLLTSLDDAPRLRKGTNMILRNVIVSNIAPTATSPASVALFLHSSSTAVLTPCEMNPDVDGERSPSCCTDSTVGTGTQHGPRTEPRTYTPSAHRLHGSKMCDWCTNPSTPFCSGTGRPHNICSACGASRTSSPFCPSTGKHH